MMRKGIMAIGMAAILWYIGTTFAYSLLHPEKSHMQVFLHTPKHLVLDFK